MGLRQNFSLEDKFAAHEGPLLMTGTQALVRLVIEQGRRDHAQGRNTAGFVTGYRGSPVGTVDMQMARAQKILDDLNILVRPAVNEDLGATMAWGTQQIARDHDKLHDGVFSLFYAKAPGIDRSGDPLRHANIYGTDPLGGVLAIGGDDPRAKSSTIASQTDVSFADLEIPVFSPMDVHDIVKLGLHGWALSRHAGVWAAMTVTPELMDGSGLVSPEQIAIHAMTSPAGYATPSGRQVPQLADRVLVEESLRDIRLPAALDYIRANKLNQQVLGPADAQLGVIASGHAMALIHDLFAELRVGPDDLAKASLAVFKVAVTWPLEPRGIEEFVRDKKRVLVLDPKRRFLEPQIRDLLFNMKKRPSIIGKKDEMGQAFLSETRQLEAMDGAHALRHLLGQKAKGNLASALDNLLARQQPANTANIFPARIPHFCSGCPHNTGTKILPGARVGAGIGCHAMVQLQEGKSTEGYTQMGGEGMTVIGAAPFRKKSYVWVNVGDGTYFHSQTLAIRQAVASGETIGFKILFNDAVAMTGGQAVDGQQSVASIVGQLKAEGVGHVIVTSDQPEKHVGLGVPVHHRDDILEAQEEMMAHEGVSVLIHDQVCATEKRRHIKRGKRAPDPALIHIHPDVCEACGDCSIQSNCVAIEPMATDLGVKRRINQSMCNTDTSCLKGFCPSFISIEGASIRKQKGRMGALDMDALVQNPPAPDWQTTPIHNLVITGVGGTGVMTMSAICSTAAHLDGLKVASSDVSGLAQKGGAVTSSIKFSLAHDVETGRIIPASAHGFMACDIVTATSEDMLTLMSKDRTKLVANANVAPTKDFIFTKGKEGGKTAPARTEFLRSLVSQLKELPAEEASIKYLGEGMFANMIILGASWRLGLVPVSREALMEAVRLNNVRVESNQHAILLGASLVNHPELMEDEAPQELRLHDYQKRLVDYHDETYAKSYMDCLAPLLEAASKIDNGPSASLSSQAARIGYRMFAIKDEFEVARLFTLPSFKQRIDEEFHHQGKIKLHLAPPFLPGIDQLTGRPAKRQFGPWILKIMALLAKFRRHRFSRWNLLARTKERQLELAWRNKFTQNMSVLAGNLRLDNIQHALEVLEAFDHVRGFGPVKMGRMEEAEIMLADALERFHKPPQKDEAA